MIAFRSSQLGTPRSDSNSSRLPLAVSRALFGWFALSAIAGLSCTEQRRPNVLVIVVDALRADRLGCYGYARSTSPNIDAFAAESVVFDRAYAQSPWTKPSIPTLFTSLYPVQHGVYEGEANAGNGILESDVLADAHSTLAETFQASGYETLAFVHNAHLEPASGFAQGFDTYEHGRADAPTINAKFIEYLDGDRHRPFFAYLHYLDAHWPFQPEMPFQNQFGAPGGPSIFDRESWNGLRERIGDGSIELSAEDRIRLQNLHDGGVAEIDHYIGMLLAALRGRGILDQTIVLFTSDHGEELMDHGSVGHGGTLYKEVIDIPLIIRIPHGAQAGRRSEIARLIDVFPTLAALARVEPPAALEGRNLFEVAVIDPGTDPEIVAETRHKRTYRVSVRKGNWKYVRTYHADRPASKSIGTKDPQLEPGMRIKAKGFFLANRTVEATKISRKDPGDDDIEISGAVIEVSTDEDFFELHGLRIEADDLVDETGRPIIDDLLAGEWVKVEGKLGRNGALHADKFKRLAKGTREDEIEAIVERTEDAPDGAIRVVAAGFHIIVTDDTRQRGFAGVEIRPAAKSREDRTDPFTPAHLLSSSAPNFEEQLFDLARDPTEQVDRIAGEDSHAEPLRAELVGWLERMALTAAAGVDRRVLDPATIEDLRALGYVE